jgi:hypothetical protein
LRRDRDDTRARLRTAEERAEQLENEKAELQGNLAEVEAEFRTAEKAYSTMVEKWQQEVDRAVTAEERAERAQSVIEYAANMPDDENMPDWARELRHRARAVLTPSSSVGDMTDRPTANGHRWPCPRYYNTGSEQGLDCICDRPAQSSGETEEQS